MKIAALLTSKNEHYCSPPRIITPMRRLLVPEGSGRTLFDPAHNPASIVGASHLADGEAVDGLWVQWDVADAWYANPPYGTKIAAFVELMAREGGREGNPGVALLPARDDTRWMQGHVFRTATAWLHVAGRLTFWLPIPLAKADAVDGYYLRRWYPWANAERLPKPFRMIGDDAAVGPELGANGKPQPAPFPSMVAFWEDPEGVGEVATVRGFMRQFLALGTITISKGEHRGVYQR